MGGAPDRYFRAFDAKTGKLVWAFRTNSDVTGVPISYGRIGVQYIAEQAGWGAEAAQMQAELETVSGTTTDVPHEKRDTPAGADHACSADTMIHIRVDGRVGVGRWALGGRRLRGSTNSCLAASTAFGPRR